MYNEEYKLSFLASTEVVAGEKNIKSFFKQVEEAENEKQKDIAAFSKEELIDYFEHSGLFNPSSVVERLRFLRRYRIWYNDHVGHCEISYLPDAVINAIDFRACIEEYFFFDPDELLDTLEDQSDIYYLTDICTYILAWHQIELSKAVKLKKTDFSFSSHEATIHVNDKIVQITHQRSVDILKHYHAIDSIIRQFAVNQSVYVEDNNVYFIRAFKAEPSGKVAPMETAAVRQRCKDRAKLRNSRLIDYRNVAQSGEMFKLFQAKQNGEDIIALLQKMHPSFSKSKIKNRVQLYNQYEEVKLNR